MCESFCCDLRPKSKTERNSIVAWRTESNELQAIWEQVMGALTAHGLDDLKRPLELLLNEAMKAEREMHLNAGPWERTEARRGHANGCKPKSLNTRLGALDLRVPQGRDSAWYPSVLERGIRSERALMCALAEMYVGQPGSATGQTRDLPVPVQGAYVHARVYDLAGSNRCSQ
jgi:hypothetical protein